MENTNSRRYLVKAKFLILLLAFGTFLIPRVDFVYAATTTQIASGLSAAVGVALDESDSYLYFVEYSAGTLKRIKLSPECEMTTTPPCPVETIATGFSHPEAVQLDLDHGFAYVTTRDDPGTTGALWKVDVSTGSKSLVTFNLGAPQQLVLDVPNNQAYVVGYDDGRLRCIDLTTGAKTPLFIGLGHPVGLAVTDDGNYAYVTEQDAPARISKIDLVLGVKVGEVVTDGVSGVSLVSPFFLAWIDSSRNSLYVVERDPVNRVARVDLTTSEKYDAVTGLPWRPSGIALSSLGTPVYVTTDNQIVKVDMVEFDLTEPVFLGIGHVPSTEIVDGYATTDPLYFYKVQHSPFGGTLNIFGNLSHFKALGATHYEVLVSKDGGPYVPLGLSWNAYKWNPAPAIAKYELVPVAPEPATTRYVIPDEYPLNAGWWYPPFLFMRWPSGENGLYTFEVKIYDAGSSDITWKLPAAKNSLTVRIDNTPPDAKILSICQKGTAGSITGPCYPDKEIKPCDIVTPGNNEYYFRITAYDANHHLRYYTLRALWGNNRSETICHDSYNNHVDEEGPYWWSGEINFSVPRTPADAPTIWGAKCNCAHTFYLRAGKRTINGYNYILRRHYHKSVTINNTGVTCGMDPCGFPCP
jgi:DNA-binding beta-propeller fold protein YncE